jgi:hypothetical protein
VPDCPLGTVGTCLGGPPSSGGTSRINLLLWRYSPYRALASSMHWLWNCLYLASVYHDCIPESSCSAPSHLFLGFPIAHLPYIVCCRAFLGICSSFIHITCPAHCSLLNLMNTDTLTSLYRCCISSCTLLQLPWDHIFTLKFSSWKYLAVPQICLSSSKFHIHNTELFLLRFCKSSFCSFDVHVVLD